MNFSIKSVNIPTKPGCYLYKDSKGQIIYVGKAKLLRNRVLSYFRSKQLDPKTQLLVSKISDVEFIITNNELEALLLEQSLIHKYQPKFNIDLKGTIRYAYIKITDEKFPRIVTSRKVDKTGEFFGPYTDGTSRREIIGTLVKLFKIRTCVTMPKKVCLQYHIGNCQGPCEKFITQEEYLHQIENARRFLRGDTKIVLKDVEKRMKEASARKEYELAKVYRDQMKTLEQAQDRQSIDQGKIHDQDVINWLFKDTKVYIQVFNVVKGVMASRHSFTLDATEWVIEEFVRHFYSIHTIPQEVVLPSTLDEQGVLQDYLRVMKQKKFALSYTPRVEIVVAQKGVKKDLLDLVKSNLEMTLGVEPGIADLQKKLQLKNPPVLIDFFDISNLKNKYIVGACIQLKNAHYHKSGYRKFKVKTTQTQDDFASMREVVFRRYNALLRDGGQLPDLVVIDGGRGQLNAAMSAFAELQLSLPLCSLAKREEEIYQPGTAAPLRYSHADTGLRLLMKGRDEVHRFVISFNRSLRKIR